MEDLARAIAIQHRLNMFAAHHRAVDAFDTRQELDVGKILLRLLFNIHRVAGAGRDGQLVAGLVLVSLARFDRDRLRRRGLTQI